MATMMEIAQLAGLLEGEGCFSKHLGDSVAISLQMTDEDVMKWAGNLVGADHIGMYKKAKPHHKPLFYWTIHGRNAAQWMMTIYPLMGSRRKATIRRALLAWRDMKLPAKYRTSCPKGHLYDSVCSIKSGKTQRICTVCRKEYGKNWRHANSDKMKSYKEAWKLKNPERANELRRERRRLNKLAQS